MRTFEREGEASSVPVELRTPLDEPLDALRTRLDQHAHCLGVAQPCAGLQGVLLMQPDLVLVAECDRDAALRVLCGRLREPVLGQHKDAACH